MNGVFEFKDVIFDYRNLVGYDWYDLTNPGLWYIRTEGHSVLAIL